MEEIVYVDGWRTTRSKGFDRNRHAMFGEEIKKHLHPKTLAEIQKEFAKGDYYGFAIGENTHPFRKVDGFVIGLVADFNFETETHWAIKQGVCETIEDCKLFVDQILYRDARFSLNWAVKNRNEGQQITVACVKDQLQIN